MPTIETLTVDIQSRTTGFSRGLKVATAGLAALAAGAAYAFKQFEDAEKVTKQTEAVIESTGGAANITAKQVDALGDAISRKTGIDDEAIQSGENLLLTFKNIANETGKGNDIFNQATIAITDMSVAMGQDFKSSAIQVGKALNDPIAGLTSLTRVGVQFSEEQRHQIEQFIKHNNLLGAQKIILGELSSQFAGSAEAQKTASQTMATALGNLAETIGGVLAPVITVLADGLTNLVGWIEDNVAPAFDHVAETVMNAWDAVKPFANAIGSVLIPLFETMWHTIQDRVLPVLERIKPLLILIGGAVVAFATVVLAQFALVVTAISFVVDKFLDLVGFIRDKVVEPVGNLLGRIVDFIGKVIDAIGRLIGWVRDRLVDAWQAIIGPIKAVIDAILGFLDRLIDRIGDAVEALRGLLQKIGESLGGNIGIPFTVPGVQHGGVVTRTGIAVVHRGEAISGVNNELGFGGIEGDIVLNVDGQTFARITRDQLLKLQKRNATSGI
jgi:phage-related protein